MKVNGYIGSDMESAYAETVVPGLRNIKLSAPVEVQYELTRRCNYACRFCYNVWKNGQANNEDCQLKTSEKIRAVERLIGLDVFGVVFSGGEPLLDGDIFCLIEILRRANIETSIITNGSLLTTQVCCGLRKAGLASMQISLHDHEPAKSDYLTRTRGSLELTANGIRNAVHEFGGHCINVNMVVTDYNYMDIIPMARFVKELGAGSFSIGSLSSSGEALSSCQRISRDNFQNAYRELIKAKDETGLMIAMTGGFPLCIILEIGEDPLDFAMNFCDAGLNQFVIAPNGDIRPCVCFPQVVGNILKDNPREVWEKSEFLRTLRRMEHVPDSCYSCRFVALCKGGCRAAAFTTYNDLKASDPLGGS